MAHTQYVRVERMKGGGIIKKAARHNLREIQAELGADSHIDPLRTSQNVVLRGARLADDVANLAKALMDEAKEKHPKAKRRKDQVLGLEAVVSLPPQSGIDEREFFTDALAWAEGFFEVPILSAVIHNDEAAPHCHIVMLPLFDGRMIGSRLFGSKQRLQAMQASFFEKVGQPYGLARQSPRKRLSAAFRRKVAVMAADYLKRNPNSLNEPTILDALRDVFISSENPALLVDALGLKVT